MPALTLAATLLVALLHVGFFVLETLLWTTPRGRKIFGNSPEDAERTKVLAANQGVYNLALGVSIAWAALAPNPPAQVALLSFVVVVGVYGALTAKGTILFLQALPAAIALALRVLVGL